MAEGKRPGGLTALAVLNFVFGGLGALGLLAIFALIGIASGTTLRTDEGTRSLGQLMNNIPGVSVLYIILLLNVVIVALLIAAGVGYLGLKKVLGRGFGNAYGILSMATSGLMLVLGWPFDIRMIIGLIYPILTLALLNTTFKEDLVN